MAHHQSSDDIAATAGRRSDDDAESFALVERFGGERFVSNEKPEQRSETRMKTKLDVHGN
jgi:hypothetical protein